jgi:hypothetical protein
MESFRLRHLFARTLRASLASPLVLAGCTGIDMTGYTSPACENGWLAVTGLSPAASTDFVQLRDVSWSGGPTGSPTPRSSSGTACATASQPEACQSALAALSTQEGFRRSCLDFCTSYFLATTRATT